MDRASSRLAVLSTHLATPVQESLHSIAAQACSAPGKLLEGKVPSSSMPVASCSHILVLKTLGIPEDLECKGIARSGIDILL